jgi:hypothetical protein
MTANRVSNPVSSGSVHDTPWTVAASSVNRGNDELSTVQSSECPRHPSYTPDQGLFDCPVSTPYGGDRPLDAGQSTRQCSVESATEPRFATSNERTSS